jgi:hypothetical protein
MGSKKIHTLLLLLVLTTFSFAEGTIDNIKAWNIKEHSVKIAFTDNMTDESLFYIEIFESKNTIVGQSIQVDASEGTGNNLIKKITGLKPNTEYEVHIGGYPKYDEWNNGIMSDVIRFTTKGSGDVGATDLKMWNIKSTSAIISFRDNTVSGTFDFITEKPTERLMLNSKGIVPAPNNKNYFVAKMIDLTPNTTYKLRIFHVIGGDIEWEKQMKASEVITFTTKK